MRIRIILPSFVLPLCLLGLLFGVSPLHSGASSQGQDGVTAAQLAAALEAQKQADAKLTRGESAEQRFQELGAKLQRKGAVRVIVQLRVAFRPEGSIRQAAERLAQRGSIRQAQDDLLNGFHLRNPRSLKRFKYLPYIAFSVDAAGLAALRSAPKVIDIYEDSFIRVAQAQSPSISLIAAPNAWESGYNGAGKTIAVLDTGVDKTHPSLSGKVVSEACYSTDDSDFLISPLCPFGATESEEPGSGVPCTAGEDCSHGTSVAGVAAGVAPGAGLISIQVNSLFSNADDCEAAGATAPCILTSPSDLGRGLDRVFDLATPEGGGYSVASANVSQALGRFTGVCDSNPVKIAIDQLRSVGIATVVAAGNEPGAEGQANVIGSPACVSTAVSVGATGDGVSLPADVVAPFSNSISFLSLLAPGYYTSAPIPGSGFNNVSGTSVAAAHVSGAWAILKQQQPSASVPEALARLRASGVNVTDPRNGVTVPRIRIGAAIGCVASAPEGHWKGEYFNNLTLAGNPTMARDDGADFLNLDFGGGSPGSACGIGADNFSARWTRTVSFSAGRHRFTTIANDGVRLYVDGQLRIDGWLDQEGATYTAEVDLNEGDHELIVEYYERGGAAMINLSWELIPVNICTVAAVPANRWKGEYFFNATLAGNPTMARDDGADFLNLDFDSGILASACGTGTANFSARWTRTVGFSAGRYRFSASANGGARLYVDGQLRVDQGGGAYTGDVDLTAGDHEIMMEYFGPTGRAQVSLSWGLSPETACVVSVQADRWKGEYYNTRTLTGSPVRVRDDGVGFLNMDFGAGGPNSACGLTEDDFSARWTSVVNFSEGLYRFSATADDGVRLYIDGQLRIDRWIDQSPTTYTADVDLTAGNHEIKMEFYEHGGTALARLSWAMAPSAACIQNVPAGNWRGEYFNNPSLTGSPVRVRDEGAGFLDFDFGGGSPSSTCGVGADNFSARWTRTINFPAGYYRFSATADDGVRLYVDGALKIDRWIDQGPTTYTADVYLTAGNHEIKMEYYEHLVTATARLSWAIAPATACIQNVQAGDWRAEYYNNPALAGDPAMVRDEGSGFGSMELFYDWNTNPYSGSPSPACGIGVDNFSVRFTRTINVTAGVYSFTAAADDLVRLYIDGQLRMDGSNHTDVYLTEGNHDLKVEYYEAGGRAFVYLYRALASGPECTANVPADHWKGEYYTNPTLTNSPRMVRDDGAGFLNFDFGANYPAATCGMISEPAYPIFIVPPYYDNFSIRWTRTVNFAAGSYRFTTSVDDGVRLYIDGALKIDKWFDQGLTTYTADVFVPAGNHEIKMEYYDRTNGAAVSLSWTPLTLSECGYALSPDGAGFSWSGGLGTITVTAAANCSWSASSDSSWITLFSGSGVSSGSVGYRVQGYNVTNGSRSGRITIAGQSFWIGQEGPPSDCDLHCRNCCLPLSSQGAALDQSATDAEPRGLTARYFDNTTLSGQPSLQRTDAIVNFDWAGASPDAALPADRFSVRWSGQLAAPASEAYTFHLYSDDGARLWVNNQLVIDRWQPPFEKQIRSAPVELKAGEKVDVRVEYYNAGGEALIQLLWSSASTPLQFIPQRHLYPEAATNKSAQTDTNKQTAMLLPPGSDAGPTATWPRHGGWPAAQLGLAGLVLLIAGCLLALLLSIKSKAVNAFSSMAPDAAASEVTMLRWIGSSPHHQKSHLVLTRRVVKVLRSFIALCNLARAANLAAYARRVRNARYAHFVTRIAPGRRAICLIVCFGLLLPTHTVALAGRGKSAEKPKALLTQGPPGLNLPDLNKARRMRPGVPKIAPPVSAAFASSIESFDPAPPPAQGVNWQKELMNPKNRVGTGGEDLLSRNFNWRAPIVNLPGRAGMDLDLRLSLNSLIWTKGGPNIQFNLDKGFPSPGFRLGFPELGAVFFDTEAGTGSMLVTMPSGRRYEFRENPALGANVYEEMSGTRMLLVVKPHPLNYLLTIWTLLLTDGTAYKFKIIANTPKCVEVKDPNGNYISVTYTTSEQIDTVTETLNRVVKFNYDGSDRLTSITQDWGGSTHTYATFAYDNVTIQTNFSGLNLVGAANGTTVSALSRVEMADGKVYAFEYNSYAQVKAIKCYAPNSDGAGDFPGDYTLLSSVLYDLPPDAADPQSDCPRFLSRKDWAKDWNQGVTTTFTADPGGAWGQETAPDGTVNREYFGVSGWRRGLTLQTETWSGGVRKKWATMEWTQDNTAVSYQLNPRVTETNVYDEFGNQKRTTMEYADFGAVSDIREYDAPPNTSTVLRRTHLEYLRGPEYTGNTSRRLTQLVTSQTVYDGGGALFSKVTYEYDLGGEYLVQQGPPVRHDTAKFGPTFVLGRGNLNRVRRWDVTDRDNVNKSVATTTGYNTSGSMIFSRDPLNHQTSLSYVDSFSDSVDRNTFAYPTTIKDADNYSSAVQYSYDFGSMTRNQDPKGAAVVNTYDSIGRLLQVTNQVNQAYTRYVYAPNHLYKQSYTTANNLGSEFYQITVFDGHGRTRGVASDHPGSAGGYKAQSFEYDIMGRLVRQTNPAEITADWAPAGDDETGWVWSSQAYDWQSRPTTTTNQDGTTRTISYDGCGCAGGQVVTFVDEMRRKRDQTYDVLGRLWRERTYWDDWLTPETYDLYTTKTNTYNVRDQVTNIAVASHSFPVESQNTVMTYDGHGRLKTRQEPIYLGNPQSATPYMSYVYYDNDLVSSVTDPRGAGVTYSYNNRDLVTNLSYSVPSGVSATPNVSFGYDETGKRLWMDDGPGRIDYEYDLQGTLKKETRRFDELPAYQYELAYEYNLQNLLRSVTTRRNGAVDTTLDFDYDGAGRLATVSGSGYGGGSPFNFTSPSSPIKYRAWGATRQITFGNNRAMNVSYNGRLQATGVEMPGLMSTTYTYNHDGRIARIHDNWQQPDPGAPWMTRRIGAFYDYDDMGRLIGAHDAMAFSNAHMYYNGFNNLWLSSRGRGLASPGVGYQTTFVNNRDQSPDVEYDQAGNTTRIKSAQYSFDAKGSPSRQSDINLSLWYDGDGLQVKEAQSNSQASITRYFLRSTAMGGRVLAELNQNGDKIYNYIYANGAVIAEYNPTGQPLPDHTFGPKGIRLEERGNEPVLWRHVDPSGRINWATRQDGAHTSWWYLDEVGNLYRTVDDDYNEALYYAAIYLQQVQSALEFYLALYGNGSNIQGGCYRNGVNGSCDQAYWALNSGALSSGQSARTPPTFPAGAPSISWRALGDALFDALRPPGIVNVDPRTPPFASGFLPAQQDTPPRKKSEEPLKESVFDAMGQEYFRRLNRERAKERNERNKKIHDCYNEAYTAYLEAHDEFFESYKGVLPPGTFDDLGQTIFSGTLGVIMGATAKAAVKGGVIGVLTDMSYNIVSSNLKAYYFTEENQKRYLTELYDCNQRYKGAGTKSYTPQRLRKGHRSIQ